MIKVGVVYLGPAKDWAGVECESIDIEPGSTLAGLIARLMERHPRLGPAREALRLAVNDEFRDEAIVLSDGDEIAVIPPVSGGCEDNLVAIVDQPIDVAKLRRHVGEDCGAGGIAIFEGVTRAETHPERGSLLRLEYEAYQEMAIKEMRRLVVTAGRRWPIIRSAMVHRIGKVACGETGVVIAVACGHRSEAFEACRWLIDSLKREVPIWKKEIWSKGQSSWIEPIEKGK